MRWPRVGWYWNQWLVGFMLDRGRIVTSQRWLVVILGPLALSFDLGQALPRYHSQQAGAPPGVKQ